MERSGPDHVDVFLVDDDVGLLSTGKRLLERAGHLVVAFSSAPEFLRRASISPPCCVVLDLRLTASGGREIQAKLARRGSTISVIYLSGEVDILASVPANPAGAIRLLVKPLRGAEFVAAVAEALSESAHAVWREGADRARSRLSPREQEVASLLARGLRSGEIGERCGVSAKTVMNRRGQIMRKLGIASVEELVQLLGDDRAGDPK